MVEGLECLNYVEPDGIDAVWPAVEKGLDRLLAKSERNAKREGRESDVPWSKDQLKEMLKGGTFDLLLGYWKGKYIGFTIITKLPREFTNEPILFVMTGYGTSREGVDAGFRDYDRIAKYCGIKKIAFCSAFRGWRHIRLAKRGFRPTKVWFEKEVELE
jgi:hypothetical protein